MFNLNLLKKKFQKILLSINKLIHSFFNKFNSSNKHKPIKKKFDNLDNKIESFFDKFKNFKKYNHSKKKFYFFNGKLVLSIALIIITTLSYFLLPVFYNKKQLLKNLKNQISNKYEINIKFNEKVRYGLFPKPFFYTKNLSIIHNDKTLGNSGYTKFYISPKNLFSQKNLNIQDTVFQNVEFNLNLDNFNFFKKSLNSFEKKEKVIFKKSKLFFKDKKEDLLFLSKINNFNFFYDDINQLQKVNLNFEIFNIPFNLDINKNNNSKKKIFKLNSKKIRFDIECTINHEPSEIRGIFDLKLINKENIFNYSIKDNVLTFMSIDENFKGNLNFKPFYFSTNLKFDYINQKKIFRNDSLLIDLLDSELLNNSNLNASINVDVGKIDKFEYLKDLILNIKLDDGRIFINNLNAKWNDSVSIKSSDVEFMNDQDGKKLVGEIIFSFEDVEKFFRYFQIKRNYRNVFEEIKLDFIYDFTLNKFTLNNLKIDNKSYKNLTNFLEQYNQKNKNLINKVTLRNFVKEFFQIYAG